MIKTFKQKANYLIIRVDNIAQKRLGQKQLFRMVGISLGKHSGYKRKDIILECKSNKDKYLEVKHLLYELDDSGNKIYDEDIYQKEKDYKRQVLKTNFLKSIKNAVVFMSVENKEKAKEIERNKSWDKVEDMLLLAGISIDFRYYDQKGKEIEE
jgi:hypothetical protein